ncbi:hypothetical protein C8F04DRAFT_1242379 [Mycena alexandri]|uniref:Transmembrane protein n=1 Tax=Mycena alexandri TaxID=1745969 RepID=A0AAD6S2V2_9AGAR|nr:hypothetical protein C8F04DRAFT_1242379 [Mycena alexandri]
MKARRSSLLIFLQVAVSCVSALPIGAATSVETRGNDHQHVPFFKYPAVEETNDARRSPLEYAPFVNYPGGGESVKNEKEERDKALRSPFVHVPFIDYPGGEEHDEADSKTGTNNVKEKRGIHRPSGRDTSSRCKPFVHYPDELKANSENGKQERAVGTRPFVHYPTDE